jgi:predicted peroxiredoxin
MSKFLFVILNDPTNLADSIKAAHTLHYAVELKEKGHDVYVYFDGLGTKIPITDSPYKGLKPAYEKAVSKDLILGACGYCASPSHLNIKDKLPKNINLIGDEEHHYAFTDLVDKGFQIIIS